MKRIITITFAILVFLGTITAQKQDARYLDGVIYFQLHPALDLTIPEISQGKPFTQAAAKATFPQIHEVLNHHEVKTLKLAFPNMNSKSLQYTYKLEFEDHANVDAITKTLELSDKIALVERAPINYTLGVPSDSRVNDMWFLDHIEAFDAWDIVDGKTDVTVAVVDDAVYIEHEDLRDNIWVNTAEWNGVQGVDDDGNGYVDDYHGWDGANNDNNPNPPSNATDQYFMHGTHVAGTVGAVTDNGRGIASIAFNNAKIMACKGGRDSDGALSGIWEAFAYAVTKNPSIITNSWGRGVDQAGNPPAPLAQFERALLNEAHQRGILVLFAAGNENNSNAVPATYETVVAVAASGNEFTGARDQKASYSNFGSWVDIAAPGTQILSCSPGSSRYVSISGTSMATPNVASLLALMKAHAPSLNREQLLNCLYSSADNIDSDNQLHVGLLGAGRINVKRAIECVSGDNISSCSTPSGLSVTDITETTGTLRWNNVTGATGYNVQIRVVGNTNWFSFDGNPFSSNFVAVTGMAVGTNYEFRVQAVCGNSTSGFSSPFTFQTINEDNAGGTTCTAYNDIYTNFSEGGDCANTPIVIDDFQVWPNEAYRINDCVPGQTYTFSICNGYSAANWVARLTAARLIDNTPSDVYASEVGCELVFTVPSNLQAPVDIVVVVSEENNCGGATQQINNGFPSLNCSDNGNQGCLTAGTVYNDLASGGICSQGPVSATFSAWTNEGYLIENCAPGQEYEFSICNGYNPNRWEAELTVVEVDDQLNILNVLGNVFGCSVRFTIPSGSNNSVDVVVVISEKGNCGEQAIQVDNGIPVISCIAENLCTAPASLSVQDVGNNDVVLAWSAVNGANSYTVQARPTGTTDWVEAFGWTDTEIPYFNLLPCTEYEFRVRTQCSNDFSDFSTPLTFTTTGCAATSCAVPSIASIDNSAPGSATITWNGDNALTGYALNYKHQAGNTWLTVNTEAEQVTLENLTSCLTYEVQVIGLCDVGQSEPSSIQTFDTDCQPCSSPSSIQFVTVTPYDSEILWSTKDSDLSYVFRAKETASSEWTEWDFNDNLVSLTGLNPCTEYDIEVKALCASGESTFSPTQKLTTLGCSGPLYCNSKGEVATFEWIQKVELGQLVNESGNNFGYKQFTEFESTVFELGQEYSVELTPGFSDDVYDEYWRIWIDLNQDGDFNDAGEMVFDLSSPTPNIVTGTFTLPASAQLGTTTMRVAMKYYDSATDADSPQSCTTFDYGEVEDYSITIDQTTSSAEPIRSDISVFPNPFTDRVQIKGLEEDHELSILDVNGKLVYQKITDSLRPQEEISLAHLPVGIYILQVMDSSNRVLRKKLIKQ